MSIATEIQRLAQAKADIKAAIEEKGVEVGNGTIDTFASKISEISTGGGDIDALIDKSITEVASNVESIGTYAFYQCSNLTSADFPLATSISFDAFSQCSNLTSVDFPVATSIDYRAFQNCSQLTSANFPATTIIRTGAFEGCSNLTSADFPLATSIGENAFSRCSNLTSVDFPVATSIGTYAFYQCSNLTSVDFPVATSIGNNAFNTSTKLIALILRSETMCTLSSTNAFTGTGIFPFVGSATGFVYVPRALVENYKSATNWSNFATRFRALEDYTVDGTVNGELDESKI